MEGAYHKEVFVLDPTLLTSVVEPLAVIMRSAVIRLAGVVAPKIRQPPCTLGEVAHEELEENME